MEWTHVITAGVIISKERVCASLRNHWALNAGFKPSNKTGWKTQCGLLAFRISLSLSLSLEFLLFPTYSSILHPTIPLSSLKLSPFPIGNCIKSRGSYQDLKLRPNYQLLLLLNTEGKSGFFWVDIASSEDGVQISVPISPSYFLYPDSSTTFF